MQSLDINFNESQNDKKILEQIQLKTLDFINQPKPKLYVFLARDVQIQGITKFVELIPKLYSIFNYRSTFKEIDAYLKNLYWIHSIDPNLEIDQKRLFNILLHDPINNLNSIDTIFETDRIAIININNEIFEQILPMNKKSFNSFI